MNRQLLLETLRRRPDVPMSPKELTRLTGLGKEAILKELKAMAENHEVTVSGGPGAGYRYRLND